MKAQNISGVTQILILPTGNNLSVPAGAIIETNSVPYGFAAITDAEFEAIRKAKITDERKNIINDGVAAEAPERQTSTTTTAGLGRGTARPSRTTIATK